MGSMYFQVNLKNTLCTNILILITLISRIISVQGNGDAPVIRNLITNHLEKFGTNCNNTIKFNSADTYEAAISEEQRIDNDFLRATTEELAGLNELIVGWSVDVDSFTIFDLPPPLASTASVSVINCRCSKFRLNDGGTFAFSGFRDDNEATNDFRVSGMAFKCELEWEFKNWVVVLERGTAQMEGVGGSSLDIVVNSIDFNENFPSSVQLSRCNFFFGVDEISFTGNFRATLAGLFDGAINDYFRTKLNPVFCDEFERKKLPLVRNGINSLSILGTPYLEQITKDQVNPLEPQENLVVPRDARLFNFTSQNPDELGVLLFDSFTNSFEEEYGIFIPDANGEPLLAINQIVRDALLDNERKLLFPFTDFICEGEELIYDGYDLNLRVQAFLKEIKLVGLDTINDFSVLDPIGKQTLRNRIKWTRFGLEMGLEAALSSTSPFEPLDVSVTLPDTTIKFTALIAFQDFEAIFTFLSAIDLNVLLGIEVKEILIAECALAFLPDFNIAELDVLFNDGGEVTVANLISPAIDEVAQNVAESIFSMFQLAFVTAIPNFIATTFRERVQETIRNLLDGFSNNQCPTVLGNAGKEFIDFNELFYNVTTVEELGIQPEFLPYGDLFALSKQWFTNNFLTPNLVGEAYLNDLFIGPLTSIFGDGAGKLKFELLPQLRNTSSPSVIFSEVEIDNIDSIGFPLRVFDPVQNDPFSLQNQFVVGVEESLEITTSLVLFNNSDRFNNTINVTLQLTDTEINSTIFAKISENSFMKFPLRDVSNPFCFLAAIPPPMDNNPTAALSDISISKNDVELLFQCVSCTSSAMEQLPQVLSTLQDMVDLIAIRMLDSAEYILKGDDTQGLIDSLLSIAGRSCPHNPDFDIEFDAGMSFISTAQQRLVLPSLSQDSAELLLLSIILSSYAASVIIPLSLDLKSYPKSDPLETFPDIDETGLIVFGNSSSSSPMSLAITSFFLRIDDSLGGTIEDVQVMEETTSIPGLNNTNSSTTVEAQVANTEKLGINALFSGFDPLQFDIFESLVLPPPFFSNDDESTTAVFEAIRVYGLDAFTEFDLFDAVLPQTIQSKFRIDEFMIEFVGTIDLPMSSPERFFASIKLKDVEIATSLYLAIVENALGNVKLGPLLDSQLALTCILPALRGLNVNQFIVDVKNIDSISYAGFLTKKTQDTLTESTSSFLKDYASSISSVLPNVTDNFVRSEINNRINSIFGNNDLQTMVNTLNCPAYRGTDEFIDFRALFGVKNASSNMTEEVNITSAAYGDIPIRIRSFIDNFLESPDTRSSFQSDEDLKPKLGSYLPESFEFMNGPVNFTLNLNQTKNAADDILAVKISDLSVQNLDSVVYPLEILKPRQDDPYALDNVITMGSDDKPLILSFILEMSFAGSSSNILNQLNVTMEMTEMKVALLLMAKIQASSLLNLPIMDLLDRNCLLATIPPAGLGGNSRSASINFDASYSNAKISAKCIECSSPFLTFLGENMDTSQSMETFNMLGASFLDLLLGPLNEALQLQLDMALLSAEALCARQEPDLNVMSMSIDFPSNTRGFGVGILIPLLLLIIIIWFMYRYLRSKTLARKKVWLESLPDNHIYRMHDKQMENDERDDGLKTSMIMNEQIFFFVRFAIPVLILASFGLYISGHINVAAYTNLEGSFAGEDVLIFQFFKLTLIDAISNGWTGNTWFLSLISLFVNIIWPYIKLLGIILVWLSTPDQLSVKKRGEVLRWLDILTKWSVTNFFVLFLAVPFYDFEIDFENLDGMILPPTFFDFRLALVLVWGFYSTFLAQILSHMISYLSMNAQEKYKSVPDFKIDDDIKSVHEVDIQSVDYESSYNDSDIISRVTDILSVASDTLKESLGIRKESGESNATDPGIPIDVDAYITQNENIIKKEIVESKTVTQSSNLPREISGDTSINSKNYKADDVSTTSSKEKIDVSKQVFVGKLENTNHSIDSVTKESLTAEDIKISTEVPRYEEGNSIHQTNHSEIPRKHKDLNLTERDSHEDANDSILYDDETIDGSSVQSEQSIGYGRIRSLSDYKFKTRFNTEDSKKIVPKATNQRLGALCILLFVLLFIGFARPVFNIQRFGLSSFLMQDEFRDVDYSVFHVVDTIRESAENLDSGGLSFGLYLLSSVFVITVVIIPLFKLICLAFMWFTPMRMRLRYVFLKIVRLLDSWQYLEVYIVAVLFLMWQGESFVETYLDAYCDDLRESFFPLMVSSGLVEEENARCFYIILEPRGALSSLIIASILLEFFNQFVKSATIQLMEDFVESLDHKEYFEKSEESSSYESEDGFREKAIKVLLWVDLNFTDIFFLFLFSKAKETIIREIEDQSGNDKKSLFTENTDIPLSITAEESLKRERSSIGENVKNDLSTNSFDSSSFGSDSSSDNDKIPKGKKRFFFF